MNVLFLMVDEMSWWGLGHMNPAVSTPNIDRLAARGMRFDAAYTPSPICVPTRASIATGKYVHEIGYWDSAQAYDGRVPSWGHQLQAAGKSCVSIGKLHYRNATDDTGFDDQIEPIHILNGVGWMQALLRRPISPYTMAYELAEMIGAGETTYTEYDRRVAECAVDWLHEDARRAEEWCAFVSFLSPHFPLMAPEEYYRLYDPKDYEGGAEEVPDHPILQEIAGFFDHDPFFTPETRGIARAAYYGLCSFVDAQVGKVLDALEASDMAEDTLIIFTSDHGEMLGEKGFWTKSVMYDSSARVPLILAGPDIAPGTRDDPVSLIDIAPTIATAMSLSPRPYSGTPLLGPIPEGRTVLSEYHDGGCSVGMTMVRWNDGDRRWKLVHFAEGYAPLLFDLATDPREQTDLAAERPGIVVEGCRRLARWMDPEVINERAHADQAAMVERLGGRDHIETFPVFNFTPADSR
jgi:choline-sulfatase